jgi:hypothetical protein
MGQPVTVIEKQTPQPGVVRYEINRAITGTGHEVFASAPDPLAVRPVDELARRLFATGKVQRVHVNSNVITVQVAGDARNVSCKGIIEELFTYYREGVPVPSPEDFGAPALS